MQNSEPFAFCMFCGGSIQDEGTEVWVDIGAGTSGAFCSEECGEKYNDDYRGGTPDD